MSESIPSSWEPVASHAQSISVPRHRGRELGTGQWQESCRKRRSFLQSLRQLRSGSPIVILRDVQTAPKVLPTGEHKPETIRLITKDFIRDLM